VWDSRTAANGAHSLGVRALLADGSLRESQRAPVTISNE